MPRLNKVSIPICSTSSHGEMEVVSRPKESDSTVAYALRGLEKTSVGTNFSNGIFTVFPYRCDVCGYVELYDINLK